MILCRLLGRVADLAGVVPGPRARRARAARGSVASDGSAGRGGGRVHGGADGAVTRVVGDARADAFEGARVPLLAFMAGQATLAVRNARAYLYSEELAISDERARIARDPAWRQELRARVIADRQRLYRDRACIAGLEAFLERAARGDAP